MLLITRRAGEKIMVGDDIVVHIKEIVGNTVRVGIEAPRSTPIYREEIWHAVREENRAAAEAPFDLPTATSRRLALPRAAHQGGLRFFARAGSVWGMNFAKTARNAAVADLALAFARDRLAAQLPGVKPRKRRPGKKTLLIGGIAATAAAALLLKRDKVAALLPGRSDEPAPPEPSYTPPPVSNYDAAGPVANTATAGARAARVRVARPIDEAERGSRRRGRGGQHRRPGQPTTPARSGEPATDAEAPLAEAGEGEAEGQEQTEHELRDAAEGNEDDGLSPEEAQINEAIDDAANPLAGRARSSRRRPARRPEWRTWSGRRIRPQLEAHAVGAGDRAARRS